MVDLVQAVKICLSDNNKNIVRLFTALVGQLCCVVDTKDIKPHLKGLLQTLY